MGEGTNIDVYPFITSSDKPQPQRAESTESTEATEETETEAEADRESKDEKDGKESKEKESLDDIIRKTEQILRGERPAESLASDADAEATESKDKDGDGGFEAKAGAETKAEAKADTETKAETEAEAEEQEQETEAEAEAEAESDEEQEEESEEEEETEAKPGRAKPSVVSPADRLKDRERRHRPLCSSMTSAAVSFMRPVLWGKNKNPCVVVGLISGDALVYHGLTGLSMAKLFDGSEPVCLLLLLLFLFHQFGSM